MLFFSPLGMLCVCAHVQWLSWTVRTRLKMIHAVQYFRKQSVHIKICCWRFLLRSLYVTILRCREWNVHPYFSCSCSVRRWICKIFAFSIFLTLMILTHFFCEGWKNDVQSAIVENKPNLINIVHHSCPLTGFGLFFFPCFYSFFL